MNATMESNIIKAFHANETHSTKNQIDLKFIKKAILIRCVEQTFLELFAQGKLNGTVHTCVGQEFSALAFAGQLNPKDFIFSNHRCHGHYLAFTGDYYGLIAELMGKSSGTCGGIGSSQHLCKDNFYSNGIQGGIVPVAAGMAMANKIKKNGQIGIVFIGDGTLGQGVVYETMNIVSKWEIPLLMVCENNYYAQTTAQDQNLAGDICKRAEAFGIRTAKSDTWHPAELFEMAQNSIDYVRCTSKPLLHIVDTYRLNPHSKGDDDRDKGEIEKYSAIDPLNLFKKNRSNEYMQIRDRVKLKIMQAVKELDSQSELPVSDYIGKENNEPNNLTFHPLKPLDSRLVKRINHFFQKRMADDPTMIVLGEDIADPYGGAFKVTKGLSTSYPEQVFSTPISESALAGVANGLAMAGMKPYLEIMFGDFMTLCTDQIINHASKFHHMYNKQIRCPVVIRTPMGGGRGYGPTHSQTLDKFLIGIDNVSTIALNCLVDPATIYDAIYLDSNHPMIVLENKIDYWKKIGGYRVPNYLYEVSDNAWPVVRIRPAISDPTATIVTYGGMAGVIIQGIESMIVEHDLKPEIIVLTRIHPIDCMPLIIASVRQTRKLFVAEEGSAFAGFGSEVVAAVSEKITEKFTAKRLSSLPVPIPSAKSMEKEVLLNLESALKGIEEVIR